MPLSEPFQSYLQSKRHNGFENRYNDRMIAFSNIELKVIGDTNIELLNDMESTMQRPLGDSLGCCTQRGRYIIVLGTFAVCTSRRSTEQSQHAISIVKLIILSNPRMYAHVTRSYHSNMCSSFPVPKKSHLKNSFRGKLEDQRPLNDY